MPSSLALALLVLVGRATATRSIGGQELESHSSYDTDVRATNFIWISP